MDMLHYIVINIYCLIATNLLYPCIIYKTSDTTPYYYYYCAVNKKTITNWSNYLIVYKFWCMWQSKLCLSGADSMLSLLCRNQKYNAQLILYKMWCVW